MQRCIDETNQRRGLGSSRHDDFDEAGPGYFIGTSHTEAESEEKRPISAKMK
jgi:hypothetical protein